MRDRARQIVDQDGRGGRGDDRLRPGELRGARQRLALEIEHLGHAFEDDVGRRERGLRIVLGHDRDARRDAVDMRRVEQAEARERAEHVAHFAQRLADSFSNAAASRGLKSTSATWCPA